MDQTGYDLIRDGNLSILQALGGGGTTESLSSFHLAQISSGVSLSNDHLSKLVSSVSLAIDHLARVASTVSLVAHLDGLYNVIQAALPQCCNMVLTGVPLPVRADDSIGGIGNAVRHRWLTITNGAATMGFGWAFHTPVGGATRTMLNSFNILPNTSMVVPDTQAFRSGSSSQSLACMYAFCASTSSGVRATFMWHQLPINHVV